MLLITQEHAINRAGSLFENLVINVGEDAGVAFTLSNLYT